MSPGVERAWATLRWRLRLNGVLWWGRPEAVLACVAQWLQDQPDHPHALATQAHWLAKVNDLHGASQVLARLRVLQPQVAAHAFNQGFVLQGLALWGEAQSAFETAIGLNPLLDRAWYGLGVVRIEQGDLLGAEQALRRNTELQPMGPLAWYQLAHLHRERGEQAQAQAVLSHLRGFEPRVARQLEREWAALT
jgi:Tfp pilus assembly protein PilF